MLFSNLKLTTMTDVRPYGFIEDGAVLVENGQIAWAGRRQDAPAGTSINCGGRLLTPGLIDCHTHLV
jgi:imidazolonepropionase